MINSNFVGCWTGRSAGLAPCRMIKARQRRSVSRVLSPERVTQGDGHFSRTPVARRLERPYPRARTGRPIALLFGLAPGGVCLADAVTRAAGELLPHRFTLTALRRRYVSVALSVGSPPLAVSQHPALRSPDFPPAVLPRPATVRSSLARSLSIALRPGVDGGPPRPSARGARPAGDERRPASG